MHKIDAEFSRDNREKRYNRKMRVIERTPKEKVYLPDYMLMKNAKWHA